MVSQSGDSIYQIGLLWLALELSNSEAITGFIAMAAYLPAALFSLHAGVTADRIDRRRIMLIADLVRILTVLIIPVAFLFDLLSPQLLGVSAFCIAIAASYFNPARDSIVPLIVPKNGLLRANSLIQTTWQFSLLIGPAFAGLILQLVGNIHLFTVDSLAYLISFIFIFLINTKQKVAPKVERSPDIVAIKQGLVWVYRHKVVFPLLLITIADNLFIMGPAIVGTPILIKQELGLGADAYALIQGCYAVGMLVGTAVLFKFGSRFGKGKILLVGMILDGLTFVPLYYMENLTQYAVIIVVHSLAIPMLTVIRASLIQSIVPQEYTGRVFALVNLSVLGMTALSSGIAGIAMEATSAKTVYLIIGFGGALCGVLGWIFAHQLRDHE